MTLTRTISRFFGLLLLAATAAAAPQFGNITITAGDAALSASSAVTVRVDDLAVQTLQGSGAVVFWSLRTGEHVVTINRNNVEVSDSVWVVSNLTTKLVVNEAEGMIRVQEVGFADQSGVLLVFGQDEVQGMPGELADGIGLFGSSGFSTAGTSWDGLSFQAASSGSLLSFSNRTAPGLALVNLGDPFAGSGQNDVKLFPDLAGHFDVQVEGLWATRDQRLSRARTNLPLLDGRATLFGAITYEDTEDAFPRWNVDSRLPHNGLDNVEALGNAQVKLNQKFTAEGQYLYKSVDRNSYDHAYYFNIEHAPREESRLYRGQGSVYGWLDDDLFLQAGFGVHGNKYTLGDGVYFDDLLTYGRPEGNPRFDATNLFYSWDREPVYDTEGNCISGCDDESHVFDEFIREQTTGWEANASVSKRIFAEIRATLYGRYQADTYRKYRHYFPTVILRDGNAWEPYAFIDAEMIGFDKLAQQTTDEAAFGSLPSPKQMAIGMSAEQIREDYFVRGSVEYWRYDPGYLAVRSGSNPFDRDGFKTDSNPNNDSLGYLLDAADLQDVEVQNRMDLRLGAGTTLREKYRLFVHLAVTHQPHSFSQQYTDLKFLEYKVTSGGYFTPLGNPGLKAIARAQFGFGGQVDVKTVKVTAQFIHEQVANTAAVWTVPALPRSYSQYKEDIDILANRYMVQVERSGPHVFTGALAGEYSTSNTFGTILPANIAWTVSNPPIEELDLGKFSVTGYVRFTPEELPNLGPGIWGQLAKRLTVDVFAHYRSGILYSPVAAYNEVTLANTAPVPTGPQLSQRGKNFFEVNAAATARIVALPHASLALRCEILNLLDTENWANVYESSGEPDNTGWLDTGEGQEFIAHHTTPDDTGLNGEQKYRLKENNPTNFGRPRTVRVLAQFTF